MAFIDWTDPEEMFGLLVEYVADEASETREATRRAFLLQLKQRLQTLQEDFENLPTVDVIHALRIIRRSTDDEFANDAVVEHLSACIEELERIQRVPDDEEN
jgi:hypothetical protein